MDLQSKMNSKRKLPAVDIIAAEEISVTASASSNSPTNKKRRTETCSNTNTSTSSFQNLNDGDIEELKRLGLNAFGFFNYDHYGKLLTPITRANNLWKRDTGIIAMDCEMVGVGPTKFNALARVSIVNEHGYCLYDKFVKPIRRVTDYRTKFSGVRESDLRNAIEFRVAQREVRKLLGRHILVGHSLKNDFGVLFLRHSSTRTRDTAEYFKRIRNLRQSPGLKTLVKEIFGVEIQQGEHSSITDAQATMALYLKVQKEWELSIKKDYKGRDILKEVRAEFLTSQDTSL